MEKQIFFAEKGLTSTSANTIANWAKELVSQSDEFSFVDETIALISQPESPVRFGIKSTSDFEKVLEKKAKAYSLIAWLREAIKAKEELQNSYYGLEEYCKEFGLELPTKPILKTTLSEEEYYNSLSLKERNHYYALEAQVSVIGKFIHPNGPFAKARKELQKRVKNPIQTDYNGKDTIIHRFQPSVTEKEVNDEFFNLQRKHRSLQSQLNKIKFGCEQAINNSNIENSKEYSIACEEYCSKYEKINAEFEAYKAKRASKISALKIIIPDDLKDIYEEVANLAKD